MVTPPPGSTGSWSGALRGRCRPPGAASLCLAPRSASGGTVFTFYGFKDCALSASLSLKKGQQGYFPVFLLLFPSLTHVKGISRSSAPLGPPTACTFRLRPSLRWNRLKPAPLSIKGTRGAGPDPRPLPIRASTPPGATRPSEPRPQHFIAPLHTRPSPQGVVEAGVFGM